MTAIACVDQNFGIGFRGEMLFSIPADLRFFRDTTLGKVVIMGHGTLKSLPGGRPLKDRENIVLSRDANLVVDGAKVCHSVEDLTALTADYPAENLFVIGGEQIYTRLLEHCQVAYITRVAASRPADKFFPRVDEMADWVLEEIMPGGGHQGIYYSFCVYSRR